MTEVSKILIAYDGSACADAALQDLKRAGLPEKVEVVVLTLADVITPPPDDEVPEEELFPPRIPSFVRQAQAEAEKAVKEARALAEKAAKQVRADFPNLEVKAEGYADAPAWGVIETADRYQTDLVIVGAHGHTVAGGRLILGSVSQRVLHEARCTVRVARCRDSGREGPVQIVIGYNGSPHAERAVEAVAARSWPAGSEARLVTALEDETFMPHDVAAEKLRAAGLTTSSVTRKGNPAHVLIEEAENWGADSIFVGTRDLHGIQHLLHGSIAAMVAASAPCSVEVVRLKKSATNS